MTRPSTPTGTPPRNPERSELAGLLRLWPFHILLLCAVYAGAGPAWNAARMAFAASAEGGVRVETEGASGRMWNGRYMLDLPVDIVNGTADMVMGVSLWVETYGCPSESARTSACRKLTAFEQYVPVRMHPGSASSFSQKMAGVAPRDGEVLRIVRRVDWIENGDAPAG